MPAHRIIQSSWEKKKKFFFLDINVFFSDINYILIINSIIKFYYRLQTEKDENRRKEDRFAIEF